MKISNGVKKVKDIKKINPFNKFRVNPERSRRIKCPIFKSKNEEIEEINKAINEAENIERKALFTERLIKEAEDLLSCERFNKEKAECKICHYLANLRKRTANLILKAKELKTEK